jgi:GrpB-like predicted nucleotidyltransferase (UPF0157 family)
MSSTVRPPGDARSTRIVLMPYNADWRARFLAMGQRLRRALGDDALRIDHEGSTAVPGLVAKPVIDIQVTVASLEPPDRIISALEPIGVSFRGDNPDRTKLLFTGDFRGVGMANVHVRPAGSFGEQFQLLFRDFLRADARARARYGDEKEKLAANPWITVDEYAEAKGDVIWAIVRDATRWAAATGWTPGPSDA